MIFLIGVVAARLRPTFFIQKCVSHSVIKTLLWTQVNDNLNIIINMASSTRAPKQWCLTKIETVNTFENWRQNLIYTLSLDKNFAPFLVSGTKWEKKTKTTTHRGFANDGEEVPEANRKTREQKVSMLELMLGQIANYCPIISRNTIVKNSTSIDNIWQTIRPHYGF